MKHIFTVSAPKQDSCQSGCGECQASCQSACKTSCTVGNQKCENQNNKISATKSA
ncbi:MAG: six-cysteine ranthipeptide SCIFF [Clostridia bacterium]|nr:six-cysteine ranthipeptide SCIFF [Clostridia bacterium]